MEIDLKNEDINSRNYKFKLKKSRTTSYFVDYLPFDTTYFSFFVIIFLFIPSYNVKLLQEKIYSLASS